MMLSTLHNECLIYMASALLVDESVCECRNRL